MQVARCYHPDCIMQEITAYKLVDFGTQLNDL
jgi:hypothetical protein